MRAIRGTTIHTTADFWCRGGFGLLPSCSLFGSRRSLCLCSTLKMCEMPAQSTKPLQISKSRSAPTLCDLVSFSVRPKKKKPEKSVPHCFISAGSPPRLQIANVSVPVGRSGVQTSFPYSLHPSIYHCSLHRCDTMILLNIYNDLVELQSNFA